MFHAWRGEFTLVHNSDLPNPFLFQKERRRFFCLSLVVNGEENQARVGQVTQKQLIRN